MCLVLYVKKIEFNTAFFSFRLFSFNYHKSLHKTIFLLCAIALSLPYYSLFWCEDSDHLK